MKAILRLAVLSSLLAAATTQADPATHRQWVERLLNVFGIETMCQAALDVTVERAVTIEPRLAGSEKALRAFLEAKVGWAVLKPEIIQLYMERLTEAETAEVVRFYESPTGRKFAALSPLFTASVIERVQTRLAQCSKEWDALIAASLNAAPPAAKPAEKEAVAP